MAQKGWSQLLTHAIVEAVKALGGSFKLVTLAPKTVREIRAPIFFITNIIIISTIITSYTYILCSTWPFPNDQQAHVSMLSLYDVCM